MPTAPNETGAIDRRTLLVGGGIGVGLVVAWAVWPRRYAPNLTAAPGETLFGAWLKIGIDGSVTVAVPQAEHGQGVYTTLPQIVADELGADWRTVGVEPAPLNPLYANPLAANTLFAGVFDGLPQGLRNAHVTRTALVMTGGSTSIRQFEADLRHAGAAARVLLCKAAARHWHTDWRACGTADGFIIHGGDKLRFAELAAAARHESLPTDLPLREGENGRLYGQSLPRLDSPAKVDGSANFAGDVRLPDMLYAAIRRGPVGASRLVSFDRGAANHVHGVRHVVDTPDWLAVAATDWWAAKQALDAMHPRFELTGAPVTTQSIDTALTKALDSDGERMAEAGDLSAAFRGAKVITADYAVALAPHGAIETPTATAHYHDGRLELWVATQAPGLVTAAAAAATGLAETRVVIHPMQIGGSFGAALEHEVAVLAARLSKDTGRPIQLILSRDEDLTHDAFRAAAHGRMAARLDSGAILGWLAKVAAPRTGHELAHRLLATDAAARAALSLPHVGDAYAVDGAEPPYKIPNFAVDHHPADIGVPTGHWRSGAHSYTCFFTESFMDELAYAAGSEPFAFRLNIIRDIRLAKCLTTLTEIGGWQGGTQGSGQGLALHSFRGSHIGVLAEAHIDEDGSPAVDRLVAVVDCGRAVNPDIVRQQIEGGLVFGMATALGTATGFTGGLPDVRGMHDLQLPRLADTPDITVELIPSEADPGGVAELAVPPVAPAIANALHAAAGFRLRRLPLRLADS